MELFFGNIKLFSSGEHSIEFKRGDDWYSEDITVNGKGITGKEKEFIIFLLSKLHNFPIWRKVFGELSTLQLAQAW